jgi:antitoxin component YwqK of YwqJK toxin-antitoxin module
MKNFFLATYISFFLFTTASVSWAEPSFFIQTLTNNFIDWFFGKVDGYITNETSEEGMEQEQEASTEKDQPETERISEKNLVMRNDLYYKKFTNLPFSGLVESYHENGQLKTTGQIINGKKNALWEKYYSNGRQKSIGHYRMGIKEGSWKYYFLNSNLKEEEFYKNGEKHGLWKTFDPQGSLLKTESYKLGELLITTFN